LNPLPEIAATVANRGRRLIIDAMSSFGAIPIDARSLDFDGLITASGKCLEECRPRVVIARARHWKPPRTIAHRLSWTCSISGSNAEDRSVALYAATHVSPPARRPGSVPGAGGQPARLTRYTENCRALVSGMRRWPQDLPADALQAPIIVTFHAPPI